MKRAIIGLIGILVILTCFVGFVATLDHRTDRNVPGSTTGAGRASATDTQPTAMEQGVTPPQR
jgi:hypothetical protein